MIQKFNNYDFSSNEFILDPYAFYKKIRLSDKVIWLPHKQEKFSTSKGVWLFSKYNDALEIFNNNENFSKNISVIRPGEKPTIFDLHVLHRDGLDHIKLRNIVEPYFKGKALRELSPLIENISKDLVNEILKKNRVDLIKDFAEVIPLYIISIIIGFPKNDIHKIRDWGLKIGLAFDSAAMSNENLEIQKNALFEFINYTKNLLDQNEKRLTGLLHELKKSEERKEITKDEVVSMVAFLIFAGHETTINLIGNGLYLLLKNTEQLDILIKNPQLIPSAVEEILRYESPEQRTSFRITTKPIKIGSKKLDIGDQVGVIIGSANRDEDIFINAEEFDITRKDNKHLAFGVGIHNCLGKSLARLEANIVFSAILPYLSNMKLTENTPNWKNNSFFRGLDTLEILMEK